MNAKTKTCPICSTTKALSDFHGYTHKNGRFYYNTYCKKCRATTLSEKWSGQRRRAIRLKIVSDSGGKCSNCGYCNEISALEFHHRNPKAKEHSIRSLINSYDKELMRKEIKKCELVCANCHREIHAKSRLPV